MTYEIGRSDRPPVYVALDFSSVDDARSIVQRLGAEGTHYKIGLQSYLAFGRSFVEELLEQHKRLFLDLKFFDIPNTVRHAVREVAAMGVDLLTIHALGGRVMLEQAVEEASLAGKGKDRQTNLLAVTYLTSMGQDDLPLPWQRAQALDDQVLTLAKLAWAAGAHGVVCSAAELAIIKRAVPGLHALVPGIRPVGADHNDQARVATPAQAATLGADYLVVGRPITRAADPAAVLTEIKREIAGVC